MLATLVTIASQVVQALIGFFVNQTIEKMNRIRVETDATDQRYVAHYKALLELKASIIEGNTEILNSIDSQLEEADTRWADIIKDKDKLRELYEKANAPDRGLGL